MKYKISQKAEFPLIFLILYLPLYLRQGETRISNPFNFYSFHIQEILISISYFLLIFYLLENINPINNIFFYKTSENRKTFKLSSSFTIYFTLLFINITLAFLLPKLLPIFNIQINSKPLSFITDPLMLIPSLLTLFCSGLTEEIFFRVYGMKRLTQAGFSGNQALFFLSTLFALGHIYEGSLGFIFALCGGFTLGLFYMKGRSLIELTVGHTLFNLTSLILNLFGKGVFE